MKINNKLMLIICTTVKLAFLSSLLCALIPYFFGEAVIIITDREIFIKNVPFSKILLALFSIEVISFIEGLPSLIEVIKKNDS